MGRKRLTLQDAHNLAESRGFKFLSPVFKNVTTKHLWGCTQGHEWLTKYNDIQQGHGCPHCSGNFRKTIQHAHNLAESRGFKFLSPVFEGTLRKHLWGCTQGHEWMTTYGNIQQGSGCPKCADKNIQDAHNLAESKGFIFLSLEFKNTHTKHLWGCKKGHEWSVSYNSIQQGSGCPHCAGTARKTIQDAHNLAQSKGYKFLSLEFKNTQTKHKWGCGQGHEWMALYSEIQRGSGCPECSDKNRGEKIVRYCFEKMLLCDFNKIRVDWMRNPETGQKLELDGYNEQMGVAFEHQGQQHEKDCRISNKFYDPKILIRDEIKRQKCKECVIKLIEVPEIGRRLRVKNLVHFLLSEFYKHNIAYPESAKSFEIDMKEFYDEYINEKSTTGIDDILKELDTIDFNDESLFADSVIDELEYWDFEDPDLFN